MLQMVEGFLYAPGSVQCPKRVGDSRKHRAEHIAIHGHALHKKGLQSQKSVGPLVSAGFVPPLVYIGFRF